MSNTQHLIEIAMTYLESETDKVHYLNNTEYQEMSAELGTPLEVFWEIAEYMTQTYIPTLMSDLLEIYHIGRPFNKV